MTVQALQRLNVGGCKALDSMALRTPALEVLLAPGCHNMHSFSELVYFPKLRELNLIGMNVGSGNGRPAASRSAQKMVYQYTGPILRA